MAPSVVVTCEHGGRGVPEAYRPLFAGREELLAGHRGWDPGSRELAQSLAERLRAPLFLATVTRLLVELNRSPDHPQLFSELSRGLSEDERHGLLREHYHPHRHGVESAVAERVAAGGPPCLHLSVHTFAALWEGRPRDVDVGLLFDPDRPPELAFCTALRDELERRLPRRLPHPTVRFNEPYLGIDDGLTTHLRRRFAADRYLGIELEVNQRFPLADPAAWPAMCGELAESCAAAVARHVPAPVPAP